MSLHSNAQLFLRAFQAYEQCDLAQLERCFHPDISWHSPGNSPISGTYRGFEEVAQYLSMFLGSEGFELNVHDVLATESHVVALIIDEVTWEGESRTLRGGLVGNVEDGKIKEVWAFNLDQAAADEYWSQQLG